MRQTLPKLKEGDVVEVEIMELLSPQEFLVSLEGDLVRVHNDTRRVFAVGQKLPLRVQSLGPLKLKIFSGAKSCRRNIDLKI